jgi:hypothetical protein
LGSVSVNINFDIVYDFDTLKTEITVPVCLVSGNEKIKFPAKIDTGSTNCVFERKHADYLQIDIESGEELYFGTATGRFLTFGHELNLEVLGLELYTKVYFIAEKGISRNILGRLGFLNNVLFGLIDYEGKLLLSQYGEDA